MPFGGPISVCQSQCCNYTTSISPNATSLAVTRSRVHVGTGAILDWGRRFSRSFQKALTVETILNGEFVKMPAHLSNPVEIARAKMFIFGFLTRPRKVFNPHGLMDKASDR
eukprot:3499319-Amphidinium_carterae.1